MDRPEFDEVYQAVRENERAGNNNLYTRIKKVRVTKKERDQNKESLVHPDLLNNQRVVFKKYHPKRIKRGLEHGESPFPVMPKIGPYVVSIFDQIEFI